MLREGASHSMWHNPETKQKQAVPRHQEIKSPLVRSICKGLSVPVPREK